MIDPVEFEKRAAEFGIDPLKAREYVTKVKDVAVLRNVPLETHLATLKAVSDAGKESAQTITVTEKRPPIPKYVNPYAGTNMERAVQGTEAEGNPAAVALNQFDPELLKAARADFDKQWDAGSGHRAAANVFAGLGSGWSGGNTVARNREMQQTEYERLKDKTLGQQKLLQEQATAGVDAAGRVSDRMRSEGTFEGTQRKMQLELDQLGLSVEQVNRMNDPNSIETLSIKEMIPQLLSQPGISPAVATNLRAIAARPGVTGQELVPLIKELSPAALEQWVKVVGGRKTQADTALAGAQTGKTGAETQQIQLGNKITNVVTEGGTKVPEGMNVALSAGPLQMSPSLLVTGGQQAGAEASARDKQQGTVAVNTGLNTITTDLLRASDLAENSGRPSMTGLGASWIAKMTSSEKEKAYAKLDQLVSSRMQYEAAAGQKTINDKDAELERLMRLSAGSFQNEMARYSEQLARQQDMINERDKHLARTGTLAGFDPYRLNAKKYLINPKTGQAVLDILSDEQLANLKKQGFKEADGFGPKAK